MQSVTERDDRAERLTDLFRELHAFASPRDRGDTDRSGANRMMRADRADGRGHEGRWRRTAPC
jgi:hypothetical protein